MQDNFRELFQTGLEMGMEEFGEQLIEESGVDYDWRSDLEEQEGQVVLQFIQQPEFLH